MLPTPDLSHLKSTDWAAGIYEPAEDTFALLDGLELDAPRLQETKPRLCLEIGSGSGCVIAFLAALLGAENATYLATDINPLAAMATIRTARQNKCSVDAVVASLCDCMLPRLKHNVDVLIFNPPYVPTSDIEQMTATTEASHAAAWAGGSDGMAVTERLLPLIATLLSPGGTFYLVAVEQNGPAEIAERMRAKGVDVEVILKRRAGCEFLSILRMQTS